jgi:hypothetical protein
MMKKGTWGMIGTSTPMTPTMKKKMAKARLWVLLRRRAGACGFLTARRPL